MTRAKYYIYRNLHTGGFSVRYKGRVIERADTLQAQGVTFKVNEKGRQNVIQAQRKGVHAFVVADSYTTSRDLADNRAYWGVTYNPYKNDSFVGVQDGKPVLQADSVIMMDGRVYATGLEG